MLMKFIQILKQNYFSAWKLSAIQSLSPELIIFAVLQVRSHVINVNVCRRGRDGVRLIKENERTPHADRI